MSDEPTTYVVRLTVKPGTPPQGFTESLDDLFRYECPAVGYLDNIESWTIHAEAVDPVLFAVPPIGNIDHITVVQGGGLPTLHFDPATSPPVDPVVNSRGETYAQVVARTDATREGRLSESGRTENWWTAKGIRTCCPGCQDREHDACYGPDFDCECQEHDHFGYFESPEWLEDE